jgi:predicted nucleic acid-binding Zn ribbon protein
MKKNPRRGSGEPVSLRDAVAAVGRELGMPPPDELGALASAWPEIVGDAVAAHATVRSVRDGVCTIEVDDPGWATQVRYAERQIVGRAETCCGAGVVRSIRVVVAGPATGPERGLERGRREGPVGPANGVR